MAIDLSEKIPYQVFHCLISLAIETQIPVVAIGKPGMGKSSIFKAVAKSMGRYFYDLKVPGKRTIAEIVGYPRAGRYKDSDLEIIDWKLHKYVADLKQADKSVLLFDDLHTADIDMQSVIMGLMYTRQFENVTLENTSMCAASNPIDGKLGLDPALCNRLFAIPGVFPMEEFSELMQAGFPDPVVPVFSNYDLFVSLHRDQTASFLRTTGGFDTPDKDAGTIECEEQFPSARTWEYVNKLLAALDGASYEGKPMNELPKYQLIRKLIVSGCVGSPAAASYFSYFKEEELPTAEQMLSDPDRILRIKDIDSRPDRLYFAVRIITRFLTNNPNHKNQKLAWDFFEALEKRERSSFCINGVKALLDIPKEKQINHKLRTKYLELFSTNTKS